MALSDSTTMKSNISKAVESTIPSASTPTTNENEDIKNEFVNRESENNMTNGHYNMTDVYMSS